MPDIVGWTIMGIFVLIFGGGLFALWRLTGGGSNNSGGSR